MRISFREIEQSFKDLEVLENDLEAWDMSLEEKTLVNLAQEMIKSQDLTTFHNEITELSYFESPQESESDEEVRDEAGDLALYFDRVIGSTMDSHKAKVNQLVELERQRIQREKEEAERRLREEQERIRKEKEEEERKLKEEQERVRKEKEAIEKSRKEAEEQAKKEAEERVKMLEAKKAKELADNKLAEEQRIKEEQEEAKRSANSIVFHKAECLETFTKYKDEIARIKKEIVEPLKQNPDLKKMVNAHKRKMNPKFGQLTNSQTQLTRITQELNQLLLEGKSDPFVFSWLLNFIAKALIAQAETEVSIKPKMAIPLAKMALNLLLLHPELKEYLMARFVKKCPLVIGFVCAIDTEEGRAKMGWKRNSEGKYEDDSQYAERLGGIMTLFAVMNRLPLDMTLIGFEQGMKHPIPMNHSWTLLARVMDAMPSLINDAHFTIIGSWWDACSSEFHEAYGQQGRKLLQLVSTKWVILGKQCASRERLKMLGDDWRNGAQNGLPPMEP